MVSRKLTDKQWDALDRMRFSTRDAKVFRNATIILLSAAGNSKPRIAQELGCSPATVDNVRKAYRQRGLDGIVPRTSPGRASRATVQYRAALREAVKTQPQSWVVRLARRRSETAWRNTCLTLIHSDVVGEKP
jgi:transposase